MVAVLLLAAFLALVHAATLPIPRAESVEMSTGRVFWSDGVVTSSYVKGYAVPRPVERRWVLFFGVAKWSDGSVSFRLVP
jgi:hypothetical protein